MFMKPKIKTILTRIITSADKPAFIIRKYYCYKYGLKLGQEIEVMMGKNYKISFPVRIVQVGTGNAGVYFPEVIKRRHNIKPSKKEIKIKLDLTDPQEYSPIVQKKINSYTKPKDNPIHKKRANHGIKPRMEIHKQIAKNEGDLNEL